MNTWSKPALARAEFVPLMAMMMSLIALSIDAMLPVLPQIGTDIGMAAGNDQQLILVALFIGMSFAQIIFGPLSDAVGRKRAIYVGYIVFMIGCLLSYLSTSVELMLAGRFLQGIGAAAPRIICLALVRDQYEGREMARIMSFVMGVFILVPAIAPSLGAGIAALFDWRAIFGAFLVMSGISWIWFALRQPETLPESRRIRLSFATLFDGIKQTLGNRVSFGYTLVAGIVFGAFIGFLATSQQIFDVIYGVPDDFPIYFGILAMGVGVASVTNGRIVVKMGMRALCGYALVVLTISSSAFYALIHLGDGQPAFILTMIYFFTTFMCFGFLIGNVNALAMEPLGHIAGVGAAVIGSISTFISVLMGGMIGAGFDGTLVPVVGAFALFGLLAMGVMHLTERGRADTGQATT